MRPKKLTKAEMPASEDGGSIGNIGIDEARSLFYRGIDPTQCKCGHCREDMADVFLDRGLPWQVVPQIVEAFFAELVRLKLADAASSVSARHGAGNQNRQCRRVAEGGQMIDDETLIKAVFKVGDGRGFLVNDHIITAAHCLGKDIPASLCLDSHDLIVLVEPLGGGAGVAMELVYVDPVSDVAVLVVIDDDYQKWCDLTEGIGGFRLALPQEGATVAKVLSLTSDAWLPFGVKLLPSTITLMPDDHSVDCGMSGSPILSDDNKAIGLVSMNTSGPLILDNIPHRVARKIADAS